jgi:hypothetical protein
MELEWGRVAREPTILYGRLWLNGATQPTKSQNKTTQFKQYGMKSTVRLLNNIRKVDSAPSIVTPLL